MKYNKLVRDNYPEIAAVKGELFTYHIADDSEYREKLGEKIKEEVEEFLRQPQIEELADIYEVIRALMQVYGFSPEDLERACALKKYNKGGFERRIILEETEFTHPQS